MPMRIAPRILSLGTTYLGLGPVVPTGPPATSNTTPGTTPSQDITSQAAALSSATSLPSLVQSSSPVTSPSISLQSTGIFQESSGSLPISSSQAPETPQQSQDPPQVPVISTHGSSGQSSSSLESQSITSSLSGSGTSPIAATVTISSRLTAMTYTTSDPLVTLPSSSSSTPQSPRGASRQGFHVGAIAGGAVGLIVGLLTLSYIIWRLRRKTRDRHFPNHAVLHEDLTAFTMPAEEKPALSPLPVFDLSPSTTSSVEQSVAAVYERENSRSNTLPLPLLDSIYLLGDFDGTAIASATPSTSEAGEAPPPPIFVRVHESRLSAGKILDLPPVYSLH
ncbi:hypothetical protein CERSUDRAFT_125272 [Gelatoporia subvermispora B]|uniref:Uncharacterized protein n=1 Tax=Ceriporiopsis subvermispora (strain B) TaxID=914234 RepID=M2R8C2_CERS8|nr:hypothetical protein CERSUDRAFT_125272 [Gelatoporia subvermispora B]